MLTKTELQKCHQFTFKRGILQECRSAEKSAQASFEFCFDHDTLLIMSGDIELNPGPKSISELRVIHINTRSLRNKTDLIDAEYQDIDILTISETWLSESISNDQILLTNFHPPIRLDRENEAFGGVAIYVKNNLCCKPRRDLHVDGLEAVWIETRVDQTRLLVGSFYRPPNSNVNYWSLIKESISNVNNLAVQFLILGDFNTDFINIPSPHFLDILNQYNLTQLVSEPTQRDCVTERGNFLFPDTGKLRHAKRLAPLPRCVNASLAECRQ